MRNTTHLEIKIDDRFHKDYFYFRDYCNRKSGYFFRNIGRIKGKQNGKL